MWSSNDKNKEMWACVVNEETMIVGHAKTFIFQAKNRFFIDFSHKICPVSSISALK